MSELHEFVDMIFDKEATARAYVSKLYRFFVKSEWTAEDEATIINPLAQQLMENNYEIVRYKNLTIIPTSFSILAMMIQMMKLLDQ